jgi:hypothetical protein
MKPFLSNNTELVGDWSEIKTRPRTPISLEQFNAKLAEIFANSKPEDKLMTLKEAARFRRAYRKATNVKK